MIDHFSGYGFNKSHSCGYGFVSYQTAYLKANHPVEYFAALLTSVKGNQDRTALYLAECRSLGITVEPPDVNRSDSDFTPTPDGSIRYGLSAVRNVGESVVEKIIAGRTEHGAFTTFVDFTSKVDPIVLNRRVIESLAKAGAFDSLGASRSALLQRDVEKGIVISASAARIADAALGTARAKEAGQFSLFGDEPAMQADVRLEELEEIPKNRLLAAEKEMLNVYVSDHPLFDVENALLAQTDAAVTDIEGKRDGDPVVLGGLVTGLQKRFTRKGDAMAVFVLEDLQGAIEVVVFPSAYQGAQSVLEPDAIVVVRGKVDTREDTPKIVAHEVRALDPAVTAGGTRAASSDEPSSSGRSGGNGGRPERSSGTPDEVRERRRRAASAGGTGPLVLEVAADRCTEDFVERLRGVLEAHPGETPVHLRLVPDGEGRPKTLKLPHRFRIERRNGLYAELKVLLGPMAFT